MEGTLFCFSFIALSLSLYGAFINGKFTFNQIKLEKELARRLAVKINIQEFKVQLNLAARKITAEATSYSEDAYQKASHGMRDEIIAVLNDMSKHEKEIILAIINQPSKKGQTHYIQRVANKTLSSIEETQAA